MHNTTVSSFNSTTLRIGMLTALSAVAMLALGFAPAPSLYYLLGASAIAVVVIASTGPKIAQPLPLLSLVLTAGVPAGLAMIFRGTSLIWAIAPVLALVVASATWMFASTRSSAHTVAAQSDDTSIVVEPTDFATADELMPKWHEKTAVTNDDSSATAA